MKYDDYIHYRYEPSKTDLICIFKIIPAHGLSVKNAAVRVAAESSNGTWSNLKVEDRILKMGAKVYSIKGNLVKIAYPYELFEEGNAPQLFSAVAGNLFGMKAVRGVRLEDIILPKKYLRKFKGPQFGVKGVRKIFNVKKRPLTATVAKPKVGLTYKEHAEVGREIWSGGLDLLKDDENLTSQSFNPFKKRVMLSLKVRDKIEKETGDKKSYLINVTSDVETMKKRAEFVKEQGGEYIMIDILTAGWSALQTMRDVAQDLGLAIHAHRAFHAAFDRNPNHGMSMKVVAKVARLIGVDQIHIGALGKLVGTKKEVVDLHKMMTQQEFTEFGLTQEWGNIKPVMPVCSGGLHPGIVPRLMDYMGHDMVIQAGGGVIGHPNGAYAGAKALRAVIDSKMAGVSLRKAAEVYPELKMALTKWGTKAPI